MKTRIPPVGPFPDEQENTLVAQSTVVGSCRCRRTDPHSDPGA